MGPIAYSVQTNGHGAMGQEWDQPVIHFYGRFCVSMHCFGSFRNPLAPWLICGGCLGPVEDRWGDWGGQELLPRLAPAGEFLGSLATSLGHPYLWFSAYFRNEFSI